VAEGASAVEVARRIEAPAARIFDILANPHRHMDFDGSDMLRGAVVDRPISGVGDTFTMKMHRLGDDYLMLNYVVEFESDRRIFWEPAPGDPLGLKVTTQPKLGFLRATVGATFSLPTIVTEVFDCGTVADRNQPSERSRIGHLQVVRTWSAMV
jgi:hypothetical protein